MIAAGCLAAISDADKRWETISEYTLSSRTRACDELCVLGAEVDDQHGLTGGAVVLGGRFVGRGACAQATDGRQAVCPSARSVPASSPASR